ncbi:CD151 antigen-like protein, partial [Brachionus plicatilis]
MGLKKSKKSSYYDRDEFDNTTFSDEKQYLLCGPLLTKTLVIIYNLLFSVSGILLILFGIWTLTNKNEFAELLSSALYLSSTYILITAGAVIIFTSLLGLVGTWLEKRKILLIFSIFLIGIFLIEFSAGVLALVYRLRLRNSLKADLENTITHYYNQSGYEKETKLLDNLQIKFKCCGSNDFRDWINSKYIKKNNETEFRIESSQFNQVAESCCISPSHLCAKRIHPSNIYYKGCVKSLEDYISNHILLLSMVGFSSFLFQGIGVFFTALLMRRIKSKESYEH